jgi:hypothetical protein
VTPTSEEWSRAFAKQALADFDAWNVLNLAMGIPPLPPSQKLHFLQMACEKLAKSHLLKAGSKMSELEQSHAYTAKNIPTIVRQQMILGGENKRVADSVRDQCKRLAREIELLSPSVDDGGRRKDNCEYPWRDAKSLRIPAEWEFTTLNLLTEPTGRNILKRIREAIRGLAE